MARAAKTFSVPPSVLIIEENPSPRRVLSLTVTVSTELEHHSYRRSLGLRISALFLRLSHEALPKATEEEVTSSCAADCLSLFAFSAVIKPMLKATWGGRVDSILEFSAYTPSPRKARAGTWGQERWL